MLDVFSSCLHNHFSKVSLYNMYRASRHVLFLKRLKDFWSVGYMGNLGVHLHFRNVSQWEEHGDTIQLCEMAIPRRLEVRLLRKGIVVNLQNVDLSRSEWDGWLPASVPNASKVMKRSNASNDAKKPVGGTDMA